MLPCDAIAKVHAAVHPNLLAGDEWGREYTIDDDGIATEPIWRYSSIADDEVCVGSDGCEYTASEDQSDDCSQ